MTAELQKINSGDSSLSFRPILLGVFLSENLRTGSWLDRLLERQIGRYHTRLFRYISLWQLGEKGCSLSESVQYLTGCVFTLRKMTTWWVCLCCEKAKNCLSVTVSQVLQNVQCASFNCPSGRHIGKVVYFRLSASQGLSQAAWTWRTHTHTHTQHTHKQSTTDELNTNVQGQGHCGLFMQNARFKRRSKNYLLKLDLCSDLNLLWRKTFFYVSKWTVYLWHNLFHEITALTFWYELFALCSPASLKFLWCQNLIQREGNKNPLVWVLDVI